MQIVDLKRTPVHSGGFCRQAVCEERLKRWNRSNRYRIITSPVFAPRANSSDEVQLLNCRNDLWSGYVHCIRQLTYFETNRKNSPIAVRLALGCVLSGPLPSTSSLFSACFKAVAQRETGSKPTKSVVGMTSSRAGLINKSTRAPQSTREQRRSSKEPHTTMDTDITLICSGLMTKLI